MSLTIRPASPSDIPVIRRFVRELAAFEQAPDAVESTEEMLHEALFGTAPAAEALLAERSGEPIGFAIFYPTFSTWTGRRGSGSTTSTSPPRPAAAAPAPPC